MKGIISGLSLSAEGILAAGTFTRWIGMYDSRGIGGTIGVFELRRIQMTRTASVEAQALHKSFRALTGTIYAWSNVAVIA